MSGVVEPVLGEVGVAVDADVGGCAVGQRESSGQGQQQRLCRAGQRHIGLLDCGPPCCPVRPPFDEPRAAALNTGSSDEAGNTKGPAHAGSASLDASLVNRVTPLPSAFMT